MSDSKKHYNELDLADAWLDWGETCALAKCQEEHRDALEGIVRNKFIAHQTTLKAGRYTDLDSYENNDGKLFFHEIESQLYQKETIKGEPFKKYLFEKIAVRDGGIAKNLTGYICGAMLITIFRENLQVTVYDKELDNNSLIEKKLTHEQALPLSRPGMENFANNIKIQQVIDRTLNEWDFDTFLAIFCRINNIPLSREEVLNIATRRKSAFSLLPERNLTPIANELEDLGCTPEDIKEIFKDVLIPKINHWAANNPQCQYLIKQLAE